MKDQTPSTFVFTAILACLVTAPALGQKTASQVEAVTGGTFLNLINTTTGESRNGFAISPLTLGANVINPVNSQSVNWSVNDTSDSSFTVGGQCVEDNNRRSGLNPDGSPITPVLGTSYNPFSFTLSGLAPGVSYDLKVVGLGRHSDPDSDPGGVLDGLRPDVGINSYDFSYGPSAGSLTTFADTAAGTLLWETKAGTAINVSGVNYFYYTALYACDIGSWTADGSGQIALFIGEGAVNTVLTGARTELDGIVVSVVPEPSTAALLALGSLALLLRRPR
jgi:hypothetical protein